MTPRLKILIAGLALSLIYAVYDYIDRNSNKPVAEKKREEKKRPKTARVDVNRIATLKAKAAKIAKSKEQKNEIILQAEFLPIPEDLLALEDEDWERDPFEEQEPEISVFPEKIKDEQEKNVPEVETTQAMSDLEQLKIESVMKLGEKVLVIINGQSFREGETVNNMLIESIESKKITFRMGNKRVVKDVGS
tara:strand:+ start:378 stop:953 length:576 start_codon:yes stop_codon:yes gene_type:complete